MIRMLLGIKNAPIMFQSAVDVIISTVKWQFGFGYLDDIVIFSKSNSNHLSHLLSVPGSLSDASVLLKLKKCFFLDGDIDYLGQIINRGKFAISDKAADAILGLKQPPNPTELKMFPSLCNVFRRFVPSFVRIETLLKKKLMKYQAFPFDCVH